MMKSNREIAEAFDTLKPSAVCIERLLEIPHQQDIRPVSEKIQKVTCLRWASGMAVLVLLLCLAGKNRAVLAQAMGKIPVIGKYFQMVMEPEPEVVPTPEEADPENKNSEKEDSGTESGIILYAQADWNDLFDVKYLQSDNYFNTYAEDIFVYQEDEGVIGFYEAQGNQFVPLETKRITEEVSVLGISGTIDYDWLEYHGHNYLAVRGTPHSVMINQEDEAAFYLRTGEDDSFWLILNLNRDIYEYPVRFDPETGEIRDVFQNVFIEGMKLSECHSLMDWEFSEDGSVFVTATVKEGDTGNVYFLDEENEEAISVSEKTGVQKIRSLKYIEGQYLILEPCEEGSYPGEYFNYYRYDPSSDECELIYEHAKIWTEGEGFDGTARVFFSGGRYDFLQDRSGIFLVDEVTGEHILVEGITEDLAEGLLPPNDPDTDILIIAVGDTEHICSRIGVIDLKEEKFSLMDRIPKSGTREYTICQRGRQMVIQAQDDNGKYDTYVYTVK